MPRSILEQLRAAHEKATRAAELRKLDTDALNSGDGMSQQHRFAQQSTDVLREYHFELDGLRNPDAAAAFWGSVLAVCDAANDWRRISKSEDRSFGKFEQRRAALVALDAALAALTHETPDAA